MRCAIMQPTYLPWAGYFNLIGLVDAFVFLDDVQFERQSWQSRNRVLVNGQPHWLSVPVCKTALDTRIKDIVIDDRKPWRRKHINMVSQSYGRCPHKDDLKPILGVISDTENVFLSDLNRKIIRTACGYLGLSPKFSLSSDLGVAGGRTARLTAMCRVLECNEYFSPPGSADYLAKDADFSVDDVTLRFQSFVPKPYPQVGSRDFISHLSIVDVVAHLGWSGAADYVREGAEALTVAQP